MDWGLVARLFAFGFIGALIGLRLSRARRLREERAKEIERMQGTSTPDLFTVRFS